MVSSIINIIFSLQHVISKRSYLTDFVVIVITITEGYIPVA